MIFLLLALVFLTSAIIAWSLLRGNVVYLFSRSLFGFVPRWRTLKRASVLKNQWPEALILIAGALKAGLTIEDAIGVLLHESPDPLKSHMAESLGQEAGWLPLEKRVERIFAGAFLALPRAALILSHQVGARAVSLLETSARLLRQKQELQDKVTTLTAQGRASAWIVGASPFAMMAFFSIASPEFMAPLYTTKLGLFLLGLVFFLVCVGLYVAHRIVQLES